MAFRRVRANVAIRMLKHGEEGMVFDDGRLQGMIAAGYLTELDDRPTPGPPITGGPATGAIAGTPGSWTPEGCIAPMGLSAVQDADPPIVASPSEAWARGQYVEVLNGNKVHWDGSQWRSGDA